MDDSFPRTADRSRAGWPCAGAAICLALALLPAEARAFGLRVSGSGEPVRWRIEVVPVALDDSLELIGGRLAVEEAVADALLAWEDSGVLPLRFAIGSSSGAEAGLGPRGADGNHVLVHPGPWPHDPTWAAVTHATYDAETGELLDADIVLDGTRRWSTAREPGAGSLDLRDVMTHEVGHLVGLEHSDVAEATMFAEAEAGTSARRSLHFDDVQAIVAAYGPPDALGREVGVGCGVAPAAPRPPGLAVIAGALLALATVRRLGRR